MVERDDELKGLLGMTEAELYKLYGQQTGAGAAEPDPETAGRNRFRVMLNNVRVSLCAHPKVREFVGEGVLQDEVALAALTFEILAQLLGSQMPALPTAAVLVVKIGLHKICGV